MGLGEVVDALERAEQLLEDGETGPAQDSLSWQRTDNDAAIQRENPAVHGAEDVTRSRERRGN